MRNVLVVAENRQGTIAGISRELITAATKLVESGGEVNVAVIGKNAPELAGELAYPGVDQIHAVEYSEGFNNEVYTTAIANLFNKVQPQVLLLPHTVAGLDYAPAVASELDLPILTKLTAIPSTDPLQVSRKAYESKVTATIQIDGVTPVMTVWEGEFDPVEGMSEAEVVNHEFNLDDLNLRSQLIDVVEEEEGDVDITNEDFIIAVGRGIEEENNIDLVKDAVEELDATLAGSRPLIESGWLPKERQVGQSGKVVTPKVYVAIGISGAVEHLAGMKGSETIIAINTDESAPIFDVADYGVVADLFDVVPALTELAK